MTVRWTDEQKAQAVLVYTATGNLADAQRSVASDEHTPSKNSVRAWAKKAGHDPEQIGEQAAAQTKAARVAAQRQWADRRTGMIHELGEIAELALDHTAAYLHDQNPKLAKEAATTCAILIDKAQVLSGDASSIIRQPWDPEAVIAEAAPRAEALRPKLVASDGQPV